MKVRADASISTKKIALYSSSVTQNLLLLIDMFAFTLSLIAARCL